MRRAWRATSPFQPRSAASSWTLGVGELILKLRQELGAGLVVVAVLADVGVGAGFGGEVA
jgi:hypothetical protein